MAHAGEDVRRCLHCGKPLPASARSDTRFDRPACKAAHRRARRHHAEAVRIGFAILDGRKAEVSRACPVCGNRFVPGHGHRSDAIYDRSSCRTAAWRKRVREGATGQRVHTAVNKTMALNEFMPLTSANAAIGVKDFSESLTAPPG
ncbi:hypothetical protein [Kitasatospora sp. NPDC085464]|uniref:hypothetical protein n=1 Tax=Kitasatospora sp. NPDC085464 TaxID=3364063 RepID=UPI0037CB5925